MEGKILFSEQQKFNQWWVWLLLVSLNGMFVYGIYKQIFRREPFGDNPASDTGLLIGFGGMLLVTVLFYMIRLQTIIKDDGIYVRFFPVHIAYRKYTWDKLTKTFVKKYNPLTEYGGWGIRLGGKGNAFNISGNQGLQLEFVNRPNLLIGTQRPEVIKDVLSKIGEYKE